MSLKTMLFGADGTDGLVTSSDINFLKMALQMIAVVALTCWAVFPFDGCLMPTIFQWLKATGRL